MPPEFECVPTKFRLWLKMSNICCVVGFSNASIGWSPKEINRTSSALIATHSRINWKSISVCLVWAWNTGWRSCTMHQNLLHHSTGGRHCTTLSSFNTNSIYIALAITFAKALYSATMLDQDTVACFVKLQDMRLELTKTARLLVDRQSHTQPNLHMWIYLLELTWICEY